MESFIPKFILSEAVKSVNADKTPPDTAIVRKVRPFPKWEGRL